MAEALLGANTPYPEAGNRKRGWVEFHNLFGGHVLSDLRMLY